MVSVCHQEKEEEEEEEEKEEEESLFPPSSAFLSRSPFRYYPNESSKDERENIGKLTCQSFYLHSSIEIIQ